MVRPVKRTLPTLDSSSERLGRSTIMNAGLAARHGIDYVHLVALAVDLERAAEFVDEMAAEKESLFPFGWEIFLLELHLLSTLQMTDPAAIELLDDVIASVLDEAEEHRLGGVIVFAVRDAVRRGELPEHFGKPFARWKKPAAALVRSLDAMFDDLAVEAADLAEACLELELVPPLAPTTRDVLTAMMATYETDAPMTDEPSEVP